MGGASIHQLELPPNSMAWSWDLDAQDHAGKNSCTQYGSMQGGPPTIVEKMEL